MPATKKGKVNQADLPRTLQRSPAKAQRTYAETLDSARAKQLGITGYSRLNKQELAEKSNTRERSRSRSTSKSRARASGSASSGAPPRATVMPATDGCRS